MERAISKELDEILGQKFPVLDDGFLVPIDYMGNDTSIVEAARISYGDGTRKVSDDRNLIRYMYRNNHMSPFEMCSIKFHIRAPIYVFRQWHRHRMSKINELSGRYSIVPDEKHKTETNAWRLQDTSNKQGSKGTIENGMGIYLTRREQELQNLAQEVYNERLKLGIAREQARKDMPLSNYSEMIWKMDLRNLLHFLNLRLDSHAQFEIQEYARAIANVVEKWVPLTWEAFSDYRLNSITFSREELKILKNLSSDHPIDEVIEQVKPNLSKRELTEFKAKYEKMTYDN